MELRGFSHSKLLTDKFEVFSTLSMQCTKLQTLEQEVKFIDTKYFSCETTYQVGSCTYAESDVKKSDSKWLYINKHTARDMIQSKSSCTWHTKV